MKKYIPLIVAFLICVPGFAQILLKGAFDVHAGVGFGVYALKSNNYEDNSSAAVPGLVNVGAAYQISNGFFIGLDYERNGFITDADSNVKAVAQNFGLTGGYNFLNGEKNVLLAFLTVGTSNFRFDNFNNQDYVTSRGSQIQFGVAWKHYFGETFGMFMNFSIPYYSYNAFKNSNGDTYEVSRVSIENNIPKYESKVFQLTMTGVNFRIGLALNFGPKS